MVKISVLCYVDKFIRIFIGLSYLTQGVEGLGIFAKEDVSLSWGRRRSRSSTMCDRATVIPPPVKCIPHWRKLACSCLSLFLCSLCQLQKWKYHAIQEGLRYVICLIFLMNQKSEKQMLISNIRDFHCLVIFHIKNRSNKILVTWGALVSFKQGAISPSETEGTFCPGTSTTQRISVLHVHDLLTEGCNSPAPSWQNRLGYQPAELAGPIWKLLPATSERKFSNGYGSLALFPSLKIAYPSILSASKSLTQSAITQTLL